MGHLVNPIAYRVGFSLTWDSKWYIKSLYYTEMLHWILLVKPLLYFIFTRRIMLRNYIYSHYKLALIGKTMYTHVYIYFSLYEKRINGVMDDYIEYQKKWRSIINRKGKYFSNFDYYKKRIIIYITFVYLFMLRLDVKKKKRKFLKTRGKLSINLFWLLSGSIDKGLNINYEVLDNIVMNKLSGVRKKRGLIRKHVNSIYLYCFLIKNINKVLKYGTFNYEKRFIRGLLSGFLYFAYLYKPIMN